MKIIIAILIFGIIVLIHEFGHFILAKVNGITVVDFSIGMGPRLCGFHAFGTQFSVRLLPIGGACMMLGEDPSLTEEVDESKRAEITRRANSVGNTEEQNSDETREKSGNKIVVKSELDEHSFFAKGVWQRIAVLFAGPGFNFILAFILSLFVIGLAGFDPSDVTGVAENGPAAVAGLKSGDEIIKINRTRVMIGREVDSYFDYHKVTEEPIALVVKRNGEKLKLQVTPQKYDKYMLGFTYSGTDSQTAQILELVTDYPMQQAGLQVNDIIVGIDDTEIRNSGDLKEYFVKHPLSETTLRLKYQRNGEESEVLVAPKFSHSGYTLGFDYNLARKKTSVLGTIRYSAREVYYWITETARSLGKLITGKLKSDEIGSVVAVVDAVGQTYEASIQYGIMDTVLNMLYITILLSANIGVMNLLPIPGLDGGKLLFCAIEVVRGKPVDREKEGIVTFVGMVLLMLLMVFLIFNDIRNLFFK